MGSRIGVKLINPHIPALVACAVLNFFCLHFEENIIQTLIVLQLMDSYIGSIFLEFYLFIYLFLYFNLINYDFHLRLSLHSLNESRWYKPCAILIDSIIYFSYFNSSHFNILFIPIDFITFATIVSRYRCALVFKFIHMLVAYRLTCRMLCNT